MDADRRTALKKAARQAEREAFLQEMPFSPAVARTFFDKVDDALKADSCRHDLRHTLAACEELALSPDALLPWLYERGGGCDCEVIANVEEQVEDAIGGMA
jgi:hypothetical protein